ncbi:hypothetical protein Tco_1544268, partial [Tanacetum coccineum]
QEPSSMVNEKEASINDGLCSTRAHDDVVRTVIDSFQDVFVVPKQFPPPRSHGHGIPLIEGDLLVNIRPYRHPPTQKDAIEAMVKELLEAGRNQSLFTYEKELLVVILALEKWMGYLLDRHFVIKSDHGSDNGAVDASSRLENQSALFSLTTFTIFTDLFQRIVNSWDGNLKKSLNVYNLVLLQRNTMLG